jgi:hypothetical protein
VVETLTQSFAERQLGHIFSFRSIWEIAHQYSHETSRTSCKKEAAVVSHSPNHGGRRPNAGRERVSDSHPLLSPFPLFHIRDYDGFVFTSRVLVVFPFLKLRFPCSSAKSYQQPTWFWIGRDENGYLVAGKRLDLPSLEPVFSLK